MSSNSATFIDTDQIASVQIEERREKNHLFLSNISFLRRKWNRTIMCGCCDEFFFRNSF